jgi:hypothetical protein
MLNTQSDKIVPLNSEDFGLDLIMNTSKLSKKPDNPNKSHMHIRLQKTFQILETYIQTDETIVSNFHEFACFVEGKITELVASFHKERMGKLD